MLQDSQIFNSFVCPKFWFILKEEHLGQPWLKGFAYSMGSKKDTANHLPSPMGAYGHYILEHNMLCLKTKTDLSSKQNA